MVTRRSWINEFVEPLLDSRLSTVEQDIDHEATDIKIDTLSEYDVSPKDVRDAVKWLRERREEHLDAWKDQEREFQRAKEQFKQAEGPDKRDLEIDAAEKQEDAEDCRRRWEKTAALFQEFRDLERQMGQITKDERTRNKIDMLDKMGDIMEGLSEEQEDRRAAEDKRARRVNQYSKQTEESDHPKPDTERFREEIAEEKLAETELGVGTDYGETLAENEDENKEVGIETGGETL